MCRDADVPNTLKCNADREKSSGLNAQKENGKFAANMFEQGVVAFLFGNNYWLKNEHISSNI